MVVIVGIASTLSLVTVANSSSLAGRQRSNPTVGTVPRVENDPRQTIPRALLSPDALSRCEERVRVRGNGESNNVFSGSLPLVAS